MEIWRRGARADPWLRRPTATGAHLRRQELRASVAGASARTRCRWSKLIEVLDCGNGYQEKEQEIDEVQTGPPQKGHEGKAFRQKNYCQKGAP